MSEDAELRARIAALAGRINQHKQTESTPAAPIGRGAGPGPTTGRGSGYHPAGRGTGRAGYHAPDRYAPYHARGGYSYKPLYAAAHRNRTLVVNSAGAAPTTRQASPTAAADSGHQWVSKRDRHMQLINTAVYDQVSQKRQLEMQASAREKQRRRDEKEKSRVKQAFQATPAGPATSLTAGTNMVREIQINNLRFRVAADGSKLIRVFDDANTDPHATPKQTKVAGVTFHRSKNGNLYRAGLVKKNMRYWNKSQELRGEKISLTADAHRDNTVKKSPELCPRFTATGTIHSDRHVAGLCATDFLETTLLGISGGRPLGLTLTRFAGVCALGNRCRYTHDPNKIAICKEYLRHGRCAAGDQACNLSHDPTPHRVPACTHFLRGNCTNPDCRYAHVAVNPAAPVCRAFGTVGFCQKGAECIERHVSECPDYANTGVCRNKKCRLPHVDTVGNLRKAKAAEANADEAATSDISSDEESYDEIDSDDVDSDNFSETEEIVMTGADQRGHDLAQQQDFVSFS